MPNKIQVKRGAKARLPILSDGEFGLCKDTKELFIGSDGANLEIASLNKATAYADKKANEIYNAIATNKTEIIDTAKNYNDIRTFNDIKIFDTVGGITSSTSDITGALVIRTPVTVGNCLMTSIYLKGYNYTGSQETIDLAISYYSYQPANPFHNYGAVNSGSFPISKVRLAVDENKRITIIINDIDSKWSYPKLFIDKVMFSFNNSPDSYRTGWDLSFTTDLSKLTNITETTIKTLESVANVQSKVSDLQDKINALDNKKANINLPTGEAKAIGFDKAYLSSSTGADIVARGLMGFRFSDSNEWSYDKWAGLMYKSSEQTIYLGGSGGVFNANSGTDVTIDLTNKVKQVTLPTKTLLGGNQVATVNQIPTTLPATGGNAYSLGGTIAGGHGNEIWGLTNALWINYRGPSDKPDTFVDTLIGDGKSKEILKVEGSTGLVRYKGVEVSTVNHSHDSNYSALGHNHDDKYVFNIRTAVADLNERLPESGFYEVEKPTKNYPPGCASWTHLINCQHSNKGNNFALQIAGSFFDQELYFRKTNNYGAGPWSKVSVDGHNHDNLYASKTIPDNRSTNQPPSWYYTNYPKQSLVEFKGSASIGLSGKTTYGALTTIAQWGDQSGGPITQTFKCADGIFERNSIGTDTWSPWEKLSSEKASGSGTFNSTTGATITHNIGNKNYKVNLTLTSNPGGYLGETWIVKNENNFIVYCSGSTTTTTFDYTIT